ncbi:retrovirus-related pol polyprotein from transposon TNT 1-94 [Tanacetum coccineum]|uniref:Retrovirus-related pol polyprotein from transposon TNT 1-94 n=1 Tax=Tanacetum coccineum TaxID=301880 RepID=A0ABQ4Y9U7_9ASTR
MGYGDYQMGNVTISRVYYMEGLGHNLFFVGQFYDSDLEVTFRKHTCNIRDLEGVDLLKGSMGSNLYMLSLGDMFLSSPICLLSKASKTKSWLWHRWLSHLNFDYITALAKQGLVCGLHRLKFQKDHLCSACALDLGKLQTKADIGIFVGYAPAKKVLQIYNILGLGPQLLTPGTISSGLAPNPPSTTPVASPVPEVVALDPANSTGSPSSNTIDQDAPSPSTSQTPQESQSLVIPSGVEEHFHDIEVAHLDNDPFFGVPILELNSKESSLRDVIPTNVQSINQPHEHLRK